MAKASFRCRCQAAARHLSEQTDVCRPVSPAPHIGHILSTISPRRATGARIGRDRAWRAYHSWARSRTFGFFGEPGIDPGRSSEGILSEARLRREMGTNLYITPALKASRIEFVGVEFTESPRGEAGRPFDIWLVA